MKRQTRIILFSGLLGLITTVALMACAALPRPVERYDDIASPTAVLITTPVTPITANAANSTACSWQWATRPNEPLSAEIHQRLTDRLRETQVVSVRAESFGENCLNANGSVQNFATMQTDFRITLLVADLSAASLDAAQERLRPLVDAVLAVLADYPPDATPGPQPGMIELAFTDTASGTATSHIWVNYQVAMDAWETQQTARELFDALGGLH